MAYPVYMHTTTITTPRYNGHADSDLDAIGEEDAVLTMDKSAYLPIVAPESGSKGKGKANGKVSSRVRVRSAAGRSAAAAGIVGTGETALPSQHSGAYLYLDRRRHLFIRSGKVARPFHERTEEHKKAAGEVASMGSKFYGAYPTKAAATVTAKTAVAGVRKGLYEDLLPVVALGYRQEDAAAVAGLFYWGEGLEDAVRSVKFRGAETLLEKKLHCVGYLAELAYGLLLAPGADVSVNPGFETCLGIFGS